MFAASKTGNSAGSVSNYIEDVFSTYLYTGTGASQTITNNINTTTYGGLTWIKSRSDATDHKLTDTARGVTKALISDTTAAQTTDTTGLTAFGTTGFTIGADSNYNTSAATYASWTFREQPKFFDVVTYTGTGSNTTVAHSLGAVPGSIIVKRTDTAAAWAVYHRSLANTQYLTLNTTAAAATGATRWNSTTPTSSVFSVGTDATVNASGGTYVAYIYAHDAGGFGLTGTDNVISCGSFTGNTTVNLGYEPQWVLVKNYGGADSWTIMDNMRGMPVTGFSQALLRPNTSGAEGVGAGVFPTATGFTATGYSGLNCIYIAIRRGPMKVPTVGTSVFTPNARTGNGADQTVSGLSFSPDLWMTKNRGSTQLNWSFDRLRGPDQPLSSNSTDNEATNTTNYFGGTPIFTPTNTGFKTIDQGQTNSNVNSYIDWLFGRAPGFFDEVCYTGTGSGTTFSHNLTVVPELIIVKGRSGATAWQIYSSALANTEYLVLNTTAAKATGTTRWNSTTPTSSVFSIGTATEVNTSAATYVAYLFATCPGVSKVGSYTGNGTTQTINCGFTGGARFVLIKRTDSTGDWYVYDTARGMTVLTDPYLLLNSTAAEVATLGSVTTVSTGFALNSAILAAINVSAATYIFLAIA